MVGYHLQLASRSLRRNPVLTALMVLAIGLGIGASITMLTVLHNLSGNPLPSRSDVLFHPQIDPRPVNLRGADPEPPDNLTYIDAVNLYRLKGPGRRVIMSSNWLPTRADVPDSPLAMQTTRPTTSDFFGMFAVPFLYGAGWSEQDDEKHAQVAVISRALNDTLFGGRNSVGKQLVIATKSFRIVGVIDDWNPQPRFYDVGGGVRRTGAFGKPDQLYIPFFTWLDVPQDYGYGDMSCWGNDDNAGDHEPRAGNCTWVGLWVQLDGRAQVDAYQRLLEGYSAGQHTAGRFEGPPNVRLRGLVDWLDYKHVVPAMARMQGWVAFGVFLICMINTVGLLVAKFLRKSGEIGVRRALGASRRQIFSQCLTEAGTIGIVGGLFGLPLAGLGLWMVRQQPVAFAPAAQLDLPMLAAALLLAVAAALAAGLWPAWRASRVTPAMQVKSL